MGYSAFLGRWASATTIGRAIELLAQYALTKCDSVAALRKLDAGVKPLVMRQLATFAFEDYSRSAAGVKGANVAQGRGSLRLTFFGMKTSISGCAKTSFKNQKNGAEGYPFAASESA